MRLTPYVGSLSPGRFGDVVLLSDVGKLTIAEVWADGAQVSDGKRYTGPVPEIRWPEWATKTVNINRTIQPQDFALAAEPGRDTMKAAVIRPFHWHPDFYTLELPVRDGAVQRDESEAITKFAIVDRFSGDGRVSKMFWRGCGPRTPDTALACSVAHDKHNIWVVGSSDAAMAKAVNALVETAGRLGAGARRRTRRHRPLRGRRLDELPFRRSARCRHAGALRRGPQGRLDVRADLPAALVSGISGAADVRDPDLCAVELGAGRAMRAGPARLHQRADRPTAPGGLVTATIGGTP